MLRPDLLLKPDGRVGVGNLRRFWVISCSHFLLHLSRSCFALDLTQLLSPQGEEEEGGLQARTVASPGGLLRLCPLVLLPGGAVPDQAAWLVITQAGERWISILCPTREPLGVLSPSSWN